MHRVAEKKSTLTKIMLNRHIAIVVLAAVTPYVLISYIHIKAFDSKYFSLQVFLWFLLGIIYTHFFEYGYHRILMHRGTRYLASIKKKHLEHHMILNGDNFTSRKEEVLRHVASRWFVFPVMFSIHSLVLQVFLPPPVLVAFLGGVVLHYVLFEVSHWFTHVEDNFFDRFVTHIPVLNWVRDYQIRHHRLHHETPNVDFNFNPPFFADLLYGTLVVPPKSQSDFVADEQPLTLQRPQLAGSLYLRLKSREGSEPGCTAPVLPVINAQGRAEPLDLPPGHYRELGSHLEGVRQLHGTAAP